MNRLKFLIAILFAVALGTGIVVGMGVARAPQSHEHGSWLADELNLTPAQSEDMKNIWSDVNGPSKSTFDRRRQFQKERDDALQALLTDDQKAAYAKIVDSYNSQAAELNHERDQAFQTAVEETKKILNDGQRVKYDELIKRGFRGHEGRPDGGPWHGALTRHGDRPEMAPAVSGSQPAVQTPMKNPPQGDGH